MFCTNCGTNNPDTNTACSTCGKPLTPVRGYAPAQPAYTQPSASIPPEYKPIGTWGYVGYNLLFSIPVVGLILVIVFACGSSGNVNVKNYARSFLCALLIGVILSVIMGVLFAAVGMSIYDMM